MRTNLRHTSTLDRTARKVLQCFSIFLSAAFSFLPLPPSLRSKTRGWFWNPRRLLRCIIAEAREEEPLDNSLWKSSFGRRRMDGAATISFDISSSSVLSLSVSLLLLWLGEEQRGGVLHGRIQQIHASIDLSYCHNHKLVGESLTWRHHCLRAHPSFLFRFLWGFRTHEWGRR